MQQDVRSDARYSDIGNLPSNFYPYGFKRLMVRPFDVGVLKLVSRAAATRNNVHMLRAVDLVIDQDVEALTQGDYYYVLTWLKLHSFPKTPLTVSWQCNAPYQGGVCNHPNAKLIHTSDLSIVSLDEAAPPSLPPELDFPRAAVIPEAYELVSDPDYQYLLPAVQWIKQGTTLREKMAFLEAQPDTSLLDVALDAQERIQHGIREVINLRCDKCGAAFDYRLELEPHNFFRR